MLFHVRMDVNIPLDYNPEEAQKLIAEEKALAQKLQEEGKWRHLWRIAGQYSNYSVFDVEDTAALHELLMSLPLYRFMRIDVTAICRHPSSIHSDDR